MKRKEIPPGHPFRKFLFRVTASGFETVGLPDGEVIRYVTDVLVDFAHVDHVEHFICGPEADQYRERPRRGLESAVRKLEEADRQGLWPASTIRKHIGDSCLFFTGIYPEHLDRDVRSVDPQTFVRLGMDAYRRVSEYDAVGPAAALFRKPSRVFPECVGALHIEREFLHDPFYAYLMRQMNW